MDDLLKPRETPVELMILRMLRARMTLPDDQHYKNLELGFAGELIMDAWLEEDLSADCLVINDLLLEQNRNLFQIDTVVIFQEKLYMLDAKHNAGDFYIDDDKWKAISGTEIQDPLLQMKRSVTLLRKLLRMNVQITPYLIFTNPEFYLYNDSPDLPAVFPTQMPRFLGKLNSQRSRIGVKEKKIAEQLLALHKHDNPRMRVPEYDFAGLKKGVVCGVCCTFMAYKGKKCICPSCGIVEDTETAVLRNVEAYRTLFPNRRMTTKAISEWCGMMGSKQKIRKILLNHFQRVGNGRFSYYVE